MATATFCRNCGDGVYRGESFDGRLSALRCAGCHYVVGRCRCLISGREKPAQHQPLGGRSVGSRSWSRSGARAKENIRSVRPPESWGLAVGRARREWYELTGHDPSGSDYRDAAAAAILSLAVALWPQVAAEMAALDDPDGV